MISATGIDTQAGWHGADRRHRQTAAHTGARICRAGAFVMRYGLAAFFVWGGLLKFADYEAKAIEPLVMNSPLFSWALPAVGLHGLAGAIGVIEIAIGLLIATRAFWPQLSAIGSMGAAVTLLVTLSFMLTTPGVWEPGYGFGFLSAMPGQFLAKDLVLFGVAVWTAGEALHTAHAADGSRQ